ncbi:hypothetical protein M0R89_16755 [Halorussus limi]|uniref:Uncharacterized protein n=1 Tax=Halorussus limi TaxID=2938695 RepID=A0A8U0HTF8_9EURY|nr:hypothetical protein [Halorussus limi]UPV74177.1 hypothetical protein M0R89_16755 [Halorussus limi]
MNRPALHATLALLFVFAGCTAPTATRLDTDSGRATANYVFNNHYDEAFEVTVYVVELPPNQSTVPVTFTLQNGTTRTFDGAGGPPIPGWAIVNATAVEPADGAITTATHRVPARSTLRLSIRNVEEDAATIEVVSTGQSSPRLEHLGIDNSGFCTRASAEIITFAPDRSQSVACGETTDASFPDSVVRHEVAVEDENSEESE